MAKSPPAFQLYPSDFLSSTSEMTAEEVGVHIRLLCHQWLKGGLPQDSGRLLAMAGQCQASSLAYAIERFGICEDGLLRHSRLEEVRSKQDAYRAKQAENGAKRWVGDAKPDAKPHAAAEPSHMPNACSPSSSLSLSSSPSSPPDSKEKICRADARRDAAKRLLAYLNLKAGKAFEEVDSNLNLIRARLADAKDDEAGMLAMIDRQVAIWSKNDQMVTFLRPLTLFGKEKFRSYYDERNQPLPSNGHKVESKQIQEAIPMRFL